MVALQHPRSLLRYETADSAADLALVRLARNCLARPKWLAFRFDVKAGNRALSCCLRKSKPKTRSHYCRA
jgi:hypothetical protein